MFELTSDQYKQINAWYASLKPEIIEIQKSRNSVLELPSDLTEEPYYGAIGGGLSYIFTPTGLGTIVEVEEYHTKKRLNVTDFSKW